MTEPCRLYTDEDVDPKVAAQLRQRGHDAVSCQDVGNAGLGLSDAWQLGYASADARVILTHNMGDYVRLAQEWEARGIPHAGILIVPRLPIGELVRRLDFHLGHYTAEYHSGVLLRLTGQARSSENAR